MPGQPVRAHARFQFSPGNSPSRIASLPPAPRNHHSASLENYHVFAEPTLGQNVATRNRKTFRPCAETVDDETSLWKPEEIRATIAANVTGSSIT
jgi:hypothetical protein